MEAQDRARRAIEIHFEQFDKKHTYKCVGLTEEMDHATLQVSGQGNDYVIQCHVYWTNEKRNQVQKVTDRINI